MAIVKTMPLYSERHSHEGGSHGKVDLGSTVYAIDTLSHQVYDLPAKQFVRYHKPSLRRGNWTPETADRTVIARMEPSIGAINPTLDSERMHSQDGQIRQAVIFTGSNGQEIKIAIDPEYTGVSSNQLKAFLAAGLEEGKFGLQEAMAVMEATRQIHLRNAEGKERAAAKIFHERASDLSYLAEYLIEHADSNQKAASLIKKGAVSVQKIVGN